MPQSQEKAHVVHNSYAIIDHCDNSGYKNLMNTQDKMVTLSASVSTTTSSLTSQIHQFAIKNSGQKMFKHVLTTFNKGRCGVISSTSSFNLLLGKIYPKIHFGGRSIECLP